jgi:hypothetical protein
VKHLPATHLSRLLTSALPASFSSLLQGNMGGGFTHFLMPVVFDGIKASSSPAFPGFLDVALASASADKSSACTLISCCRAAWVVVSPTFLCIVFDGIKASGSPAFQDCTKPVH